MRLALAGFEAADDVTAWSGTPYGMFSGLRDAGVDVVALSPGHRSPTTIPRRVLHRFLPGRFPAKAVRSDLDARVTAASLSRRATASGVDAVLSYTSLPAPYYSARAPLFIWTDATVPLLLDYYEEFSGFTARQQREARRLEERALRTARHSFFSSAWAADSAVREYGLPAEKVSVVEYGANLWERPDAGPRRRTTAAARGLIVASEWQRKGVPVAVDAVAAARASGLEVELSIVGVPAPAGVTLPAWVTHHSWKSKGDDRQVAELDEIFRSADFFLLPSEAECTAMVLAEAAAYALPSIVSDTGGMAAVVRHGETGLIVGERDAAGFAEAIRALVVDEDHRLRLAGNARARYEEVLNWPVACRRVVETITGVLESERPGVVPQ